MKIKVQTITKSSFLCPKKHFYAEKFGFIEKKCEVCICKIDLT